MNISYEKLKKIPKVELHCHLDGSLRTESIIEQAKLDGIKIPSYNFHTLDSQIRLGKKRVTLEEYINRFEITLRVMQNPQALKRFAFELIEDVSKENVKYIEIRYSPFLHTKCGMSLEDTIESVHKGLIKGEKKFNVKSGIIVCGIRHISPEVSLKLANLAVRFKDRGVVGFDLAGAEENFPAKEHREAFYLIRNNNINCTIHAGEAYGASSIHQAIHYCGANRIGHGTRLREDIDLMNYINDHRIPLEICISSNYHTNTVKSLRAHPIKYYYRKGIRVTINTDNRLISNTTLTKELLLAHQLFGFNLNNFKEITINAMKSAFINHKKRIALIKSILREFEKDFGLISNLS